MDESETVVTEDEHRPNMLLQENEDGDLEELEEQGENLEATEAVNTDEDLSDAQRRLNEDIAKAASLEDAEEYEIAEAESEVAEEEYEEDGEEERESSDYLRTHPLSYAGRFETSPATIQLPPETFVEPMTALLASASNKHLKEVAHRAFGGPALPNSTATPSSTRHLQQQPVALEAAQPKMKEMEANAFVAAIMPGAYAVVMSTLVETRKRLGQDWLAQLMYKEGGPRILDAGAGGAAVLAWRDMLRAEWEMFHPEETAQKSTIRPNPVPLGKATVVTGSPELRRRASDFLENTTFLPRLPDYFPAKHHPTLDNSDAPLRKQYDVIVAPYTLWTLKEDYMRKAQIENFWSLLNPHGGVLIVIEKGVPRGFELVAGARELLLKKHISSPGSSQVENALDGSNPNRFSDKETGMIVAPCTNHEQCPMYTITGRTTGRKDYCHFSQRFLRPAYLQRILGAKQRNHEDIRFSYISVQRGRDKRQTHRLEQNDAATDNAFEGYMHSDETSFDSTEIGSETGYSRDASQPLMQTLPRSILPPLKRRGHVTLDLCTPSGKLERWTVPKSFGKQAYRDARKSQWGDLWALGAKTRVVRTARSGTKKHDGDRKRVIQIGVRGGDEEDDVRVIDRGIKGKGKRDKKGKAMSPKEIRKLLEEEDD